MNTVITILCEFCHELKSLTYMYFRHDFLPLFQILIFPLWFFFFYCIYTSNFVNVLFVCWPRIKTMSDCFIPHTVYLLCIRLDMFWFIFQICVQFMPRSQGAFSQYWEVQSRGSTSNSVRIELKGEVCMLS